MSNIREATHSPGKSQTKALVILALGLVGALAIAAFLSRGAPEELPAETRVALPADTTARARGPEDAPVRLVEFGDYQCPTCGYFHPIVSELLRTFPNELRFEYRHFPLISIHPNALAAAVAAESAGAQGQYWEMHDMLFANQAAWSSAIDPEPIFVAFAERLGLDSDQFRASFRADAMQRPILADVTEARTLGINGTPTFFVNGTVIGLPGSQAEFESIIRRAIAAAE